MRFFPGDQNLVLIVDDTPTNLTVISDVLSHAGLEVAIATSGERAFELVRRDPPDLILLDIMMPGMGGFEICRRLKADPQLQTIPVIFMTAITDIESKVKGLELGAVDYITKPFQEQEVVARVRTHLELRKTQLQLQRSEERLAGILNSLQEVVWSAVLEPFELVYVNPSVARVYGLSPEDLIREPQLWLACVEPSDRPLLATQLVGQPVAGPFELEYRVRRADGQCRWVQCKAKIQWDEAQQRWRVDGTLEDISARRQVEQQLLYTAQHDSLTQLANRAFFTETLNQVLQAERDQTHDRFAVLFIDLDRFKSVNDSLGRGVGDALLVQVGKILVESTRPTDLVARLGGDEFTILLQGIADDGEALCISDRIQQRLQVPIAVGDHWLTVTASMGIVIESKVYHAAEEVLRDADIAMYQAKRLGKACYQLFSQEMYERTIYKIYLEHELKQALNKKEIFLQYQPITNVKTGGLAGFEALIRWQHSHRGLMLPNEFIPLAEEIGMITQLGTYVLREACYQMHHWQQLYPAAHYWTMNVNLSSYQLQSTQFLNQLDEILAETQLSAKHLKLEITESLLMESTDFNLQILTLLKERGVSLSLDDFGTGYSSLSYLHRFPISTLKIDRSFVQSMKPGASSFEIVRAIMALARSLAIDVIAEGVETALQVEYLKLLGCEMVQGYFFSKPLNAQAANHYLQQELGSLWLEGVNQERVA